MIRLSISITNTNAAPDDDKAVVTIRHLIIIGDSEKGGDIYSKIVGQLAAMTDTVTHHYVKNALGKTIDGAV